MSTRAGPGADRYLLPLKEWRNDRVRRTGIAPVAVANNALLKEIARLAPADMDSLRAVPGIRRWQVTDFGVELLGLVAKVTESRSASAPTKPRRRRRKKAPSSNG